MKLRLLFAVVCASGIAAAEIPGYRIATLAGASSSDENVTARTAPLGQPEGLALDAAGTLYVADALDHRIRAIGKDGKMRTVAGSGIAGFAGDGGDAVAARLDRPYGTALDTAGNLYIADLGNARVRRVAASTGKIETLAGGGSGTPVDGMRATEARLVSPRNVAVDGAGNVYFSDFGGHRVFRVDASGRLYVVAGTGGPGRLGEGKPGPEAELAYPAGLALDGRGVLYIADSGNKRILRVITGRVWPLAVATPGGVETTLLTMPTSIAIDGTGALFVGNRDSARVLKITAAGSYGEVAALGHELVASSDRVLYGSQGTTVLRYDVVQGTAETVAGAGELGFSGDGGPALQARLNGPYVAVEGPDGALYVGDMLNHRVRRIDASGGISTWAGNGDPEMLNEPAGLAFDSTGRLFIADRGSHRILVRDGGGRLAVYAGTGQAGFNGETAALKTQFNAPHAIVFDAAGNLYVADTGNGRVRRVSPAGVVTTFAGGGMNAGLERIAALALKLDEPRGLAWDAAGNLWIAETGSGRLRCVSQTGYATTPFTMRFAAPRSLAFGRGGVLLLAESGAHRISAITPEGGYFPLAGTGERGFAGDGGPALEGMLSGPMDVVVRADGSLVVADFGNNRLRGVSEAAAPPAVVLPALMVTHAASLREGPVASGQIVTLWGEGFPMNPEVLASDQRATVLFAGANQINAILPEGLPLANARIVVRSNAEVAAAGTVEVVAANPALFTADGRAAALNQDGTVNSVENPVSRGSVICLFGTGLGKSSVVQVQIDAYAAEVLYAGPAPGLAGVFQVNARVPAGFVPAGDLRVFVKAGGRQSPAGVTIAVK